ncbi:MAG: LysE family transporter [Demequinaceae bacterium]|nr:LysE family transporter [Demequinaceae bacterium]
MNSDVVASGLAGVAAGLAIAMPLGAIGLLLLRLGMLHGFRKGAAGALAVGSVDLAYCAAAVTIGSKASPLVESWGSVPLVVSGLVVIAIGAHQLVTARATPSTDVAPRTPGNALAIYGRFIALTAMNPLTLLYFIALAGVLAGTTSGVATKVAFVAGTGGASISWQLALAAVGAVMHRTISARTGRIIGIVASAIVIALGTGVIIRACVSG